MRNVEQETLQAQVTAEIARTVFEKASGIQQALIALLEKYNAVSAQREQLEEEMAKLVEKIERWKLNIQAVTGKNEVTETDPALSLALRQLEGLSDTVTACDRQLQNVLEEGSRLSERLSGIKAQLLPENPSRN